tara:strand:- start:69 stop:593 length:525 start_codon:yes stop_codon:yes gene_type:complete
MFKFPWCSDASTKEIVKPKKYDPSKLSPHFTLQELTKSQTAERLALDNTPSIAEIEALRALCIHVMEHVREAAGSPVIVSSGFRSQFLCEEIGSSHTSQHAKGEAVDFEVIGKDNYFMACWIRDNLEYDQLILEYYQPGKPNSGWIHVSYKDCGQNRNQALTFDGRKYHKGLVK